MYITIKYHFQIPFYAHHQNTKTYHLMAKSALEILENRMFLLPDLQCVPLSEAAFAHDQMELGQGGGSLYLSP